MNKILRHLLLLSLFLCSFKSWSQVEVSRNYTTTALNLQTTLSEEDDKFANPVSRADILSSSFSNAVTLKVLDDKYLPNDFSCTVTLRIQHWANPEQTEPTEIASQPLTVTYSKTAGVDYKKSDTYNFNGAYKVNVIVTGINSSLGATELPYLQLSCDVIAQHKYKFLTGSAIKVSSAVFMNNTTQGPSHLQLTWDRVTGGEEYDLEWATVDKGSDLEGVVLGLLDKAYSTGLNADKVFLNNATRITTSENSYRISLLHNANYLLTRIRHVHYTADGVREEGDWTYDYKNPNTSAPPEKEYIYSVWDISSGWHAPDLNWQYSASYAEGGKKKEVVNYFDGSLRGRQSVTINNSDNVAVVQENVYDDFGRVSASILPAPEKSTTGTERLRYIPNFNQNETGTPYNLSNLKQACDLAPDPLKISSGASKYYSPNNAFFQDAGFLADRPFTKYIPDASKYPLSVTQYTPDNTGRIKLQGGVGTPFQPGLEGQGKVTRYFYGKPEQWELDRLFGNDVGYAEHYTKNMVIDPNGQISISYMNASGKTIATALTGAGLPGLENLPSNPASETQSIRILSPGQMKFNSTELKLTGTTTYLASVTDAAANFSFDIEKLVHSFPETGTLKVNSDCNYDLTIKVKNFCGQDVVLQGIQQPIVLGPDKAANGSFNLNIDKVGEYYFTFELALRREEILDRTENYITEGQSKGIVKKEYDFIKNYLNQLDLVSCFGDCTSCIELLGTEAGFTAMVKDKLLELEVATAVFDQQDYKDLVQLKYTQLKTQCQASQSNCPAESPCSKYEKLMVLDVRPGGQYSLFDNDKVALEQDINILHNKWRTVFPVKDASSSEYQSELIELEDDQVTSPYDQNFTLDMLVTFWKEDWGYKFLPYHPEYCKLEFCYTNSELIAWDNTLQERIVRTSDFNYIKVGTGVPVPQLQYNDNWLLDIDPFFNKTTSPGKDLKGAMLADLQNYSANILKFEANANVQTKGLSKFVDYMLYCADKSSPAHPANTNNSWNSCSPVSNCRVPNREWQSYRDIYFEIKNKYIKQARDQACQNYCSPGTPVGLTGQGEVATQNFTIKSAGENAAACSTAGQKPLTVYYTGLTSGVPYNLYVEVYYPDQTAPVIVTFNKGDVEKQVCVGGNSPVNSVKVLKVIKL